MRETKWVSKLRWRMEVQLSFFFFQAEDGIRDKLVTGVQTCALPILQPLGRATGTNRIGFTLSGDATYDVKIMSATGAQVGTVATRSASAGDVQVLWNGKDAGGRSVPAGTYIVQIRATGPDGETVKAIQPFAVLR